MGYVGIRINSPVLTAWFRAAVKIAGASSPMQV
jgi:hypothetical protein